MENGISVVMLILVLSLVTLTASPRLPIEIMKLEGGSSCTDFAIDFDTSQQEAFEATDVHYFVVNRFAAIDRVDLCFLLCRALRRRFGT